MSKQYSALYERLYITVKSAKDVSMEETKWREITHRHGSLVHLVLGHAEWYDSFILSVCIKVNWHITSLPIKQEAGPIIRVMVKIKTTSLKQPHYIQYIYSAFHCSI